MKLIVLSDSHGNTDTITSICNRETEADAFFHCGDSELQSNHEQLAGMYVVRGNCDWDNTFDESFLAEIDDTQVFMVHGHKHGVKQSLLQLKYAAEETEAQIVLFGHSHLYGAEIQSNVLYVNPGSTILPRGGRPATYAVIETNGKVFDVTFRDPMTGTIVEEVNFTIR